MLRSIRYAALAAGLGIFAAASARADAPPVVIDSPWTRATPGHGDTGAVYFALTSPGADRLLGAATPAAARAEIHLHTTAGGVMTMRQVDGVDLPAGKKVIFAPHGYHLMLFGLKAPLKAGDALPLTLTFAHAAPQTISVPVIGLRDKAPVAAIPGPDPGMGQMDHMDMGHMN